MNVLYIFKLVASGNLNFIEVALSVEPMKLVALWPNLGGCEFLPEYKFAHFFNCGLAADDCYVFLLRFFEQYPQYSENKFYVSGESYAGKAYSFGP